MMAVPIYRELFRDCIIQAPCAAPMQRRKNEPEILFAFLVPFDPLGDGEQCAQVDQARHARATLGQKRPFAWKAKTQRAQPGQVRHPEKIIQLGQGPQRTPLAFGALALGTLHQPPSPGVGCGIAN